MIANWFESDIIKKGVQGSSLWKIRHLCLVFTLWWVTMMPTHDTLRDRHTFLMAIEPSSLTKFKQASLKVTSVELQQPLCVHVRTIHTNTNVSLI